MGLTQGGKRYSNQIKKDLLRKASSRKINRKEQIESLMDFIDAKMGQNINLNQAKLQLINCQLCSMA